MNNQSNEQQKDQSSFLSVFLRRIPLLLAAVMTYYALNFAFSQKVEVLSLMRMDPYSNSLESKIQVLCRIIFILGAVIGLLIQLVMMSRIYYKTVYPTNGKDPLAIVLLNRLIENALQNNFFFLGNLAYFAFCGISSSEKVDPIVIFERNSVIACVGALYILSRVVFCITYAIGIAIKFPNLRAFGHIPCHAISVMLLLENVGFNIFSSYQTILS